MNIQNKLTIQGMDILVVDDLPKNLQIIGNILKDYEFNLRFALNGNNALASIAIKKPDMILLDINMPEMDGFELCQRIKSSEQTSDILVIFITAAKKDENSIVQGFKVGGVDYITKPFNQDELIARITSHLYLKAYSDYQKSIIEEKNRMFSIFVHDIKNPFTSIIGLSELTLLKIEKIPKENLIKNLETINTSGKRILKLLEDLTSWIGLQNNKISFNPEKINLFETIQNIVNLFSPNATAKNIKINYSHSDIDIFADRSMFETIIRNFLNNSIKFTNYNGTISIDFGPIKNMAQIIISDDGIGMAPEMINKLLSNKINISTKGTNQEPGTGLGIGICKEMIKKNKGNLMINSTIGKGTSIKFTIPIYKKQESES